MLKFEAAKAVEGERFGLSAGDGPVLEVTLVAVKALERRNIPDHLPDPFTLFFKGPAEVYCPQGTYRLENPGLGAIEMFIVPVERDAETGGFVYQAVFN